MTQTTNTENAASAANEWGKKDYCKSFPFGDSAEAVLNLSNGVATVALPTCPTEGFAVPLNISHSYRYDNPESGFGRGWRLSLQRKLKEQEKDGERVFEFTDEFGDKHIFDELYYYVDNRSKVFVNKSNVEADISGNLLVTVNGVKREVKKLQRYGGYTIISELKGIKNAELLQTKSNEYAELENYVNTYGPALKNYVRVNSANGEITKRMEALDKSSYEELIEDITPTSEDVIMSESEALQLRSLYDGLEQNKTQDKQCLYQGEHLIIQVNQHDLQRLQINLQAQTLDMQNEVISRQCSELNKSFIGLNFHDEKNKTAAEKDADRVSANHYINYHNNEKTIELLNGGSSDELDNQYNINQAQRTIVMGDIEANKEQSAIIKKQKALIQAQIDFLIKQARENFENVKSSFYNFFAKKAQFAILEKQTPVNYIKDGNEVISGFNAEGDLVCMFDNFGNSTVFEYDLNGRITAAHDSGGKILNFEYNSKKLVSITDNLGRKTCFEYLGEVYLDKITYPDGSFLKFDYGTVFLCTVISDKKVRGELYFDYLTHRLEKIEKYVSTQTISVNTSGDGETADDKLTEKFEFIYGDPRSKDDNYIAVMGSDPECNKYFTQIAYFDGSKDIYVFSDSKKVESVTTKNIFNKDTVTTYEYSTDSDGNKYVKARTNDGITGKQSYETYAYNDYDYPVYEEKEGIKVSATCNAKYRTEYVYDENDRLEKQKYISYFETANEVKKTVSYVKYIYNSNGALALKESATEGEEDTSGINYEKYIYDKNGNVVKTIKWNSLDSSTKFYTENVTTENGLVSAEKDGLGEVCAEYEYIDGTNIVNSINYAGGGKLSYGRNPYNFTVNSVTQSDENGEANATDIIYKRGLPVEVKSGDTVINYEYDGEGRKTAVYINGKKQEEFEYNDFSAEDFETQYKLGGSSATYYISDSETVKIESGKQTALGDYGALNILETVTVNDNVYMTRRFNLDGTLNRVEDKVSGGICTYAYNESGQLRSIQHDGLGVAFSEANEFDKYGRLTAKYLLGTLSNSYDYTYKNTLSTEIDYIQTGNYKIRPLSDNCGRNTGKEITSKSGRISCEYISYRKIGDHATVMPSTVWFADRSSVKDSIKYSYDNRGNITEIKENGHVTARYTYDSLNRLIREDNKPFNKTVLFTYDNNGNICERCEYAYTSKTGEELEELTCNHFNYEYENGRLADYNGETFAYNNIGSPTTYRGKAATWEYGKLLKSYDGNTFGYNCYGQRISKNGTEYAYDNDGNIVYSSDGLEFIYDGTGITGFTYKFKYYFYRKDAQGNIKAILDRNGKAVVKYEYDAWGNCKIVADEEHTTLANLNPIRYRGYFYDTETGLYYLKSRYYDPATGRFISQDSTEYADPETINGLNLYAYCGNNPLMNVDPNGTVFWLFLFGSMLLGGLLTGAAKAITTAVSGGSANDSLGAFVGGFINGAAIGGALFLGGIVGIGTVLSAGSIIGIASYLTVGTFGLGVLASWAEDRIKGNPIQIENLFIDGALTFTEGLFSFGLGTVLGIAGFMEHLKPGYGLKDTLSITKDIFMTEFGSFGIKGLITGLGVYLKEYVGAMALKSFLKWTFVSVWDFLRPKKGG